MRAREATITVLDFEGTGAAAGHPDEPWQIGLIALSAGRIVAGSAFSSLLHVGDRPFSPYAPGRHAAVRDQLRRAPRLAELWPDLAPRLGVSALAAHNVATERKYLSKAFPLHGFGPWIDTLKLLRTAFPGLVSHALSDVLRDLGLAARVAALAPPGLEPHDALYDAIGCAAAIEHLLAQPGWEDATVAALSRRPSAGGRAWRG